MFIHKEWNKNLILNKEWYEKTLDYYREGVVDDKMVTPIEHCNAEENYFNQLKMLNVEDVVTKSKEELQYLPIPWALDLVHVQWAWLYDEKILKRYEELGFLGNNKDIELSFSDKESKIIKKLCGLLKTFRNCDFVDELIVNKEGFKGLAELVSHIHFIGHIIVTPTLDCTRDLVTELQEYGCRLREITFLSLDNIPTIRENEKLQEAISERGCLGRAIDFLEYEKEYEPLAKFLLGESLICDTEKNAKKIIKKYDFRFKIPLYYFEWITSYQDESMISQKVNSQDDWSVMPPYRDRFMINGRNYIKEEDRSFFRSGLFDVAKERGYPCAYLGDILKPKQSFNKAIKAALGFAKRRLVMPNKFVKNVIKASIKKYKKMRWRDVELYSSIDDIYEKDFSCLETIKPQAENEMIKVALSEIGVLGRAWDFIECEEQYQPLARYWLNNIVVCDTLASATEIVKKYGRAFDVVTLKGDRFMKDGRLVVRA